ncbi:MAG: alkaline phosphatase family protein [bacterium]|nr:alkaline phosphatase family protein [bacterium]
MSSKVVMVLCDGLGDAPARDRMGFLEHLVEEQAATRYTSRAVLPTTSRPNYESLHTGVAPLEHGIVSNFIVRESKLPNVFSLATAAGLTTAAVGYQWFSEMYHRSPYDRIGHSEYDDGDAGITHGRFYMSEDQPDAEVVIAAVLMAQRHAPSYVLTHTMGIDHAGHLHGRGSDDYNQAVTNLDMILALAIPALLELGYSVLVTADHGHDDHKYHGGTGDDVRDVPMYCIRPNGGGNGVQPDVLSHLQVAPTLCHALGIEPAPTMRAEPFAW